MGSVGTGLFAIIAGIFCIFCAYKDYNWFMNSSKAWLFVKLFGRNGARFFYMGLGAFLIVIGLLLMVMG